MAVLRQQDPTTTVHHRDIYHITASISRAQRQNKSPSEAFVALLEVEKAAGNVYFGCDVILMAISQ